MPKSIEPVKCLVNFGDYAVNHLIRTLIEEFEFFLNVFFRDFFIEKDWERFESPEGSPVLAIQRLNAQLTLALLSRRAARFDVGFFCAPFMCALVFGPIFFIFPTLRFGLCFGLCFRLCFGLCVCSSFIESEDSQTNQLFYVLFRCSIEPQGHSSFRDLIVSYRCRVVQKVQK